MDDKIKVSQEVLDGINSVRETGVTNMFDTKAVAHIAKVMGYTEAADWILANTKDYAQGIFNGFEVV